MRNGSPIVKKGDGLRVRNHKKFSSTRLFETVTCRGKFPISQPLLNLNSNRRKRGKILNGFSFPRINLHLQFVQFHFQSTHTNLLPTFALNNQTTIQTNKSKRHTKIHKNANLQFHYSTKELQRTRWLFFWM